jgi:hypothetical protein
MKNFFSIGWITGLTFGASVLAGGVAAPAAEAATIVTATYTGTIRGGVDSGGFFGGTLNAGEAFSLVSVFDTGSGTYSSAGGGSITGGGKATMTVNGNAFTFNVAPSSYALDSFGNIKLFLGDTGATFLSANFFAAGLPGSILTPFDKDCFADTFCSGSFQIASSGGFTDGAFDAVHLKVEVSATPLPASLPLFVSALLGLGFVTRRRNAATPL